MHNLNFTFRYDPFHGNKAFSVKDLCFSYENMEDLPEGENFIENLSFSVEKGERVAVVGKNGRGKTTILKLIAKELTPLRGDVYMSESVKMGYFGQTNINRLNLSATVEEEIALANPTLSFGQVRKICGTMMFSNDDAKKSISVLSGGERSRVLLGKILASKCNLLLLDEPTHHLDIESVEALTNAINNFPGAVVLVTHSELILQKIELTKLVICHLRGHHLFQGDYEHFMYKEGWGDEEKITKAKKKKENRQKLNQKKISLEEKAIEKLEREIESICDKLASGDNPDFIELSKELAKKKKELDDRFDSLDKLIS